MRRAGDADRSRPGSGAASMEPAEIGVPAARPIEERQGLTARAVVVGLVLVVGFTVACVFGVYLRYENPGTGYLPRGAVALLLALVGVNALLRWLKRRGLKLLSSGELIAVFVMLLAMGAVPNQEFAQHFYLNLVGISYYAQPPVTTSDLYLEDLNPLLVPSTDPNAPVNRWAHEGMPPGRSIPWRAWVTPLLWWTPFLLALYWMVLCFAALLAHRWEAEEKLLYPLVQVPIEVIQGEPEATSSVLRSPLMWVAFSVPVLHYTVAALHGYWPTVPVLNLEPVGGRIFSGPMSAFNRMLYYIRFDMIGIAYLLSAEVSFSLWFFFIFRRIQQAVRIAVGVNRNHYRFFEMQCIGGYALLGVALLWSAREHLARAGRIALGLLRPDPGAADADEPYRTTVLGFLAALAVVITWCIYSGMAAVWAVVQYALFPIVGMVVARVVCEAGMFIYSSPFRLNEAIFRLAGTERIGAGNLTVMTMASWCQIRSTATQNMAAVAQGLSLGSRMKLPRGQVMLVAMLAITVAILTSHIVAPYIIYTWSVPKLASWPSRSALHATNTLVRFIETPVVVGGEEWLGIGMGALTSLVLVALRRRFVWWPLHPLGFITWLGWPIDRYWMSILLGWLWKTSVLRFGGYKGFSALRPIAFGLILGMNVIFTIVLALHYIWPAPAIMID